MATRNPVITQSLSDMSERNFLAPGECLVYVENRQSFADVRGTTQIAKIMRSYIEADILWFDLNLVTDSDGDRIHSNNIITVSADNIVSQRIFHNIEPRSFYHFASLTFSENIEYPITAGGFVIKKNLTRPLENTSRSAFGSGIYGRYIENTSDISAFLTDTNQTVYKIDCINPYMIQDEEHGESLTVASLNTNRYMDRILSLLRPEANLTIETALTQIQMNQSPNLLTLWNIVLYRTGDGITQDQLDNLLANYAVRYLRSDLLVDSVNGDFIQELPINAIMHSLGYDGLLAADPYNNGWDRGSVSYDYAQAIILKGETARY